jgi:hypothetical protein
LSRASRGRLGPAILGAPRRGTIAQRPIDHSLDRAARPRKCDSGFRFLAPGSVEPSSAVRACSTRDSHEPRTPHPRSALRQSRALPPARCLSPYSRIPSLQIPHCLFLGLTLFLGLDRTASSLERGAGEGLPGRPSSGSKGATAGGVRRSSGRGRARKGSRARRTGVERADGYGRDEGENSQTMKSNDSTRKTKWTGQAALRRCISAKAIAFSKIISRHSAAIVQ